MSETERTSSTTTPAGHHLLAQRPDPASYAKVSEIADQIRAHERSFANRLACRIMPTRRLSLWIMVLPVVLVLYIFELWRLAAARREFTRHFMVAVDRALNAAVEEVLWSTEPDYQELAELTAPDDRGIRHAQQHLLRIMVEYYAALLQSDGSCFETLVRRAYSSRDAYLEEMAARDRAVRRVGERAHERLLPKESKHEERAYREVLDGLVTASAELRRRDAARFFADRKAS